MTMIPDQFGNFTKPDDDAEVSILLASETEWHPFNPKDFEWQDIALAAARIPRFNGQLSPKYACKPWDNYVLAQHLCLCWDLAWETDPNLPIDTLLAILLHDGEEPLGGLGDPVGPVKHSPFFRASFKSYFDPILDVIADKARIPRALLRGDPTVKQFDRMAYKIENCHLRGIGMGKDLMIPARHWTSISGVETFNVWGTFEAFENLTNAINGTLTLKAEREASNG
jgi:hypothetical protein